MAEHSAHAKIPVIFYHIMDLLEKHKIRLNWIKSNQEMHLKFF